MIPRDYITQRRELVLWNEDLQVEQGLKIAIWLHMDRCSDGRACESKASEIE